MKGQRVLALSLAVSRGNFMSSAYVTPFSRRNYISDNTRLFMSTFPDPERMRQIMEEEAKNPQNMKATANMLKNLKPNDIDAMLREMDSMPAEQKKQLEAMGMNPNIMRQTMEMMKSNPEMAKSMANMMESMSPEELLEKSRQAQTNFASVPLGSTPSKSSSGSGIVEAEIVQEKEQEEEDDDDSDPIPPPSAEILDTLYKTAELMSVPPDGKVTLSGFSTIPPVSLLIGDDPENDVSRKELAECWADASMGASRVDRAGFERMWVEVQEYFYQPILEKARERSVDKAKKKRGGTEKTGMSDVVSKTASPTSTTTNKSPTPSTAYQRVGDDISPEQLEKQVKNMSDSDMTMMLEQMKNMTPEQEARMRAMGVDPSMMKKTASIMSGNLLLKNAAKMMMKNMSAEDMKKASQQAQEQMSKMSPDDIQKAMDEFEKRNK